MLSVMVGLLISSTHSQAQSFQININIGAQPAWGPAGYKYVDYYYFPDLNVYYNVNNRLFVFHDGRGFWVESNYLPYEYQRYDLYRMYKVVINNQLYPWRYNQRHYHEFAHYRNRYNQLVIRDCRDSFYKQSRKNKYHWYHSNPKKYRNRKAEYAHAPAWRENNRRSYENRQTYDHRRSQNNRQIERRDDRRQNEYRNRPQDEQRRSTTRQEAITLRTKNDNRARTNSSNRSSSATNRSSNVRNKESSSNQRSTVVTTRDSRQSNVKKNESTRKNENKSERRSNSRSLRYVSN